MEAEPIIREFLSLDRSRRPRVVVLGDFLIDDLHNVRMDRVSPEYPIPIIKSWTHVPVERLPGGAANVVRQLSRLNVDSCLFSLINPEADKVAERAGIDCSPSVRNIEYRVPVKRRYYHGDHMVSRWDTEAEGMTSSDSTLADGRERLAADFDDFLRNHEVGAVIAADYEKGVFDDKLARQVVRACRRHGVPLIVDPKKSIRRWRGCSVFKPNFREAQAMSGRNDCDFEVIHRVWKMSRSRSVVVTDEGRGVSGWCDREPFMYSPVRRVQDVRDTVGAGDCFAAFLATAMAHGMRVPQAAVVGFEAGAAYVQKRHAYPVAPHELLGRVDPLGAKVVSAEEFARIRPHLKGTVVFTNGCLDILHAGHLSTLRYAKDAGDILVVGVNDDAGVRRLKGDGRPAVPLADRAALLASLGAVDFVVPFSEDTPTALIDIAKPAFIVKGGQYREAEVVGADRAPVLYAPHIDGRSTTSIIERIRGGDITPVENNTSGGSQCCGNKAN